MSRQLERDRWITGLLLAGLVGLVVVSLLNLGGSMPELPRPARATNTAPAAIPVVSIDAMFQAGPPVSVTSTGRALNPFYTTYFQPPPPKPPTTRKVDLTYLGHVEAAAGGRRAFVKSGDTTLILTNGATVLADLVVAEIGLRSLVLTNKTGATNRVEFNIRKEVEVPLP